MAKKPPTTIREALQSLARTTSPDRRSYIRSIIGYAVSMGEQEAFMSGRIYAQNGEKESPAEIQTKLQQNVAGAVRRALVNNWYKPESA